MLFEKQMYKTLFIDFDDTLYDTRGNAELSLREMFAHFQLSKYFPQPDDFYRSYWKTNVELWDAYAKGEIDRDYLIVERFRRPLAEGRDAKGRPFEPTREFCLEVSDVFLDMCADKPGVVEGAHELMAYLREKGYGLYMCSNGFHEVQYRKLRACGLLDAFDGVILSEDAGANKPSQAYFDYAIRTSGASVSETLMIGDNFSTDILGAKAAGLHTMFFNRHPDAFQATEPVDYEIHALREAMRWL
ncbi:MAG: YjjG family noncanonical pyrimidine nucleotidase [Paludibacteraceae bacterium]|nr:YjjG family noncanonical pyrimidine nucleotidase [Paludibacteraceae bacterium]